MWPQFIWHSSQKSRKVCGWRSYSKGGWRWGSRKRNHMLICFFFLFLFFFDNSKRTRRRSPATFYVPPWTVLHTWPYWECQLNSPTFGDQRLELSDRRSKDRAPVHEKNSSAERTGNRCSDGWHIRFLFNRKYIHLQQRQLWNTDAAAAF